MSDICCQEKIQAIWFFGKLIEKMTNGLNFLQFAL